MRRDRCGTSDALHRFTLYSTFKYSNQLYTKTTAHCRYTYSVLVMRNICNLCNIHWQYISRYFFWPLFLENNVELFHADTQSIWTSKKTISKMECSRAGGVSTVATCRHSRIDVAIWRQHEQLCIFVSTAQILELLILLLAFISIGRLCLRDLLLFNRLSVDWIRCSSMKLNSDAKLIEMSTIC